MPEPSRKVLENLNEQILALSEQIDGVVLWQEALTLALGELVPGFARQFLEAYNHSQKTSGPRTREVLAILEAKLKEKS